MSERSAMKKRTPSKCWAVVDDFGDIWSHHGLWRLAVARKRSLKREGVISRLTIVRLVERRERRKR